MVRTSSITVPSFVGALTSHAAGGEGRGKYIRCFSPATERSAYAAVFRLLMGRFCGFLLCRGDMMRQLGEIWRVGVDRVWGVRSLLLAEFQPVL